MDTVNQLKILKIKGDIGTTLYTCTSVANVKE
jgi:hypothetical protein